jgi:hypothetical protein
VKKILSLLSVFIFILQSCSPNNNEVENNPVIADDFKPPYTVKYELQFPLDKMEPNGYTRTYYNCENNGQWWPLTTQGQCGGGQTNSTLFQSNGKWTRTVLVTVNNNPLQLAVKTDFNPTSDAIVYCKMYVNNVLVFSKPINVYPHPPYPPSYSSAHYSLY